MIVIRLLLNTHLKRSSMKSSGGYAFILQVLLLFTIVILSVITWRSISALEVELSKKSADENFMESMYIQDNIATSISNNGFSTTLQTLQFDKPKLICYYSSQSCGGCVEFATQKMKEFFPDMDTNPNVPFVASGFNEKIKA